MDICKIKAELECIIRSTEKLDFPFFSSLEKKQAIIKREREALDTQIEMLLCETAINFADLDQKQMSLWEAADRDARAEFGSLSEKNMLNGFYLQEVMHRYAEAWAGAILQNLEISQ